MIYVPEQGFLAAILAYLFLFLMKKFDVQMINLRVPQWLLILFFAAGGVAGRNTSELILFIIPTIYLLAAAYIDYCTQSVYVMPAYLLLLIGAAYFAYLHCILSDCLIAAVIYCAIVFIMHFTGAFASGDAVVFTAMCPFVLFKAKSLQENVLTVLLCFLAAPILTAALYGIIRGKKQIALVPYIAAAWQLLLTIS